MLARRIPKVAGLVISQIQRGIHLSTSSLPTYPYLLLQMNVIRDSPTGNGERLVNFNYYDLVQKRRVTIEEQRIPESIHLSRNIGSSRGWMIRMNNEDLSVHLTNMFNPSVPKSSHKVISLPPFVPLPCSLDPSESIPLTEYVRNVSLSSSPDQEDCIVAIKFWGTCISFCRRSGDSSSWSWSHKDDLLSDYKVSSVIYSNAASMFYITPLSCEKHGDPWLILELYEYEHGYVDHIDKRRFVRRKDKHRFPFVAYFQELGPFERPYKLSGFEYKQMKRCFSGGNRFLVETPSGDIFTLMRYMETMTKILCFCENESDLYAVETKRFEVYKHDISKGAESYMKDIGDLCIFFGKNEPFCIIASMYPGLKPNSIYFTEMDKVCVYDIATHTIDELPHQEHLLTPFWIHPII